MQKKYLFIIIILLLLLAVGAILLFTSKGKQQLVQNPSSPSAASSTTVAPSSTQTNATSTLGFKTYRNEQWSFEFQYPNDWVVLENSFGSYYSKFNVVVGPTVGAAAGDPSPFLVNIVLPEFADHAFLGAHPITSTVNVAGASGIKYEYEFEGASEVAIVLPYGQYKIILGTGNPYITFFNQIVMTFKFLK